MHHNPHSFTFTPEAVHTSCLTCKEPYDLHYLAPMSHHKLTAIPIPQTKSGRHISDTRSVIQPSTLCPHVATPQRFTHWLTPYGINFMNHLLLTFPLDIIIHNRLVLTQSVSPQTLSNYAAGLVKFTQFCDDFNIPETACMPTMEPLLYIFITTHGASKVGNGTLTSLLIGLKLWHTINGAPWLGRARLSRTVKGTASFAPPSSTQPPRLPVTIDHLCTLKSNLQLLDPFDTAVWDQRNHPPVTSWHRSLHSNGSRQMEIQCLPNLLA